MEEVEVYQQAKSKLDLAKRKQDAAILQQIVEPLAEAIEELTYTIQQSKREIEKPETEPEYFDKEHNKNLVESINKVFTLLQNFKQGDIKIDLSPVNAIATEIKRQNDSMMGLLNKFNNNQSEELHRLIVSMISRQNAFIEKGFSQIDYSDQLKKISETIVDNKPEKVEKIDVVYREGGHIDFVRPIYKK